MKSALRFSAFTTSTTRPLLLSTALCLIFNSLAITQAQAALNAGDLVITEVLANPGAVSDTAGEWFEVYNASGITLDLTGLVIRDNGSNTHTLSGEMPILVSAGEYFVLGRSGNTLTNGGYSADYLYSNFTLGNTSDAIILESEGVLIDSLIYNDAALFGAAGNSAELTAAGFALTPNAFTFGSGDIGTPGSAGSYTPPGASPVPVPASLWLMVSALGALAGGRISQRRGQHASE